jgi:putative PIN family toxin of toxin-antitoxin system
MQKVIIDTNIIVSALISPGIPSKIITELVFEHKIELHISHEIFSEYVEVLMRPKFSKITKFQVNAEIAISRIEELAIRTEPIEKLDLIKDKSDNCFLELALATQADYLITGNSNDFTFNKIDKTKIVSPSSYWNQYHPDREIGSGKN